MEEAKESEASSSIENSLSSVEGPTSQVSTVSLVILPRNEDNHVRDTTMDPAISDMDSVTAEISMEIDIADEDNKAVLPQQSEAPTPLPFHAPKDLNCIVQQSDDRNADTPLEGPANNGHITSAKIADMETRPLVSADKLQSQVDVSDTETKASRVAKILRKAVANRGLIDTAAPFESVRQAVSKFGGTVDWKERHKHVQGELEKVQEEIPKYKKLSEDAELVQTQVLKQLDLARRQVEELKLTLEKAETEEAQAKQDFELAELWAKEKEQGITNNVSLAAKAQLEVAKGRYANAILELTSVREELEALERDYVSLVHERDMAIRNSEDSVSALKENEKTVEDLTIELITTKQLLECSHSAHLEAEEKRINAVLSWEKEKANWEKELKQAEEELQNLNNQLLLTNDLKSKLDSASTLLASLQAELATYAEGKTNEEMIFIEKKFADQGGQLKDEETNVRAALILSRKELEEVKASIVNAEDEVNCLRIAESSLKSELQMEQPLLTTFREREALASTSISSLEAELSRATTELELIITREKEKREKMEELPKTLQQAAQEADQAKAVAHLAREELQKAKEEAEQAKAGLSTMETRLTAALKEIEAAKASEKLATSAVNALEESEQTTEESPTKVSLPFEEYYELSKRAHAAEELGNKKVISAIEEIKAAKESESRSLERLQEANKELEERKNELRAAVEKAEKAKESKLGMEDELRQWRAEHEQRRKDSDVTELVHQGSSEPKGYTSEPETSTDYTPVATRHKFFMSRSNSKDSSMTDTKPRRKTFFPRIVMFLARKKVQTLK